MKRIGLMGALLIGFVAGLSLGFTNPSAPARAPTAIGLTSPSLYIHDPYVGGAASGIPNVTGRPVGCSPTQPIGIYDDGGTVGVNCLDIGLGNLGVDGGQAYLAGQLFHPPTPTGNVALLYGFEFDAGHPVLPLVRDSYFGLPVPIGFFNDFSAFGTDSRWEVTCARPNGYANTGTSITNSAGGGTIATSGASSSPVWATTSLYTRSRVLLMTAVSTAASLNVGVILQTGLQGAWRGDGAGKGGFLFWTRVAINTGAAGANQQRAFFGLINRTSILTANADPNSFADTVYIGANSNEQNLSICSNDNSGNATCATLGSSFPATTTGAFYDIWFMAAPGASQIEWYINRLDSAATASGTLTSDLPRNSVNFGWQDLINTGSAGGVAVALGWLGVCLAYNY